MDQIQEVQAHIDQLKAMGVDLGTIQAVAQSAYTGGTTSLGLNRWSLNDKPTMEDFNRDNEIIDREIHELKANKTNKDDFIFSNNREGYYRLPGGFTVQWGRIEVTVSEAAQITFPIPFTSVYALTFGMDNATGGTAIVKLTGMYNEYATVLLNVLDKGDLYRPFWIAIGYIA